MSEAGRIAQVQRIIDDEPWNCEVRRQGLTPDDAETTFTFVGRVVPAGTRAVSYQRAPWGVPGEEPVSRYSYAVLAPAGTPKLVARDELTATRNGVVRRFFVIQGFEFTYKTEVVMDELQ